jgi:dihydrofolate reductase
MKKILIVAHDENLVIGLNNSIPWKNKEDMRLFRDTTINNTVIMGRKTWDSLPKKPLANRFNIVISSQDFPNTNNTNYEKSFEEALNNPNIIGDVFIIGGSSIYEYALTNNLVDELRISLIPGKHEGDVFFNTIDLNKWIKYNITFFKTFKQVTYKFNTGEFVCNI